jgi:hypothetical protein
MGTSQIIMLVLLGINLLLGAYYHGKPRNGNYNFWITAISAGLYFLILTTGGFFK